jgi:hypothetical protein
MSMYLDLHYYAFSAQCAFEGDCVCLFISLHISAQELLNGIMFEGKFGLMSMQCGMLIAKFSQFGLSSFSCWTICTL